PRQHSFLAANRTRPTGFLHWNFEREFFCCFWVLDDSSRRLWKWGLRHLECHQELRKPSLSLLVPRLPSLLPGSCSQYEGPRRLPATVSTIADSVRWAEEILKEIDRRRPA